MIVTTGGRSARSSSASEKVGASGSSSAAVTISILRSYSSAIALIESSVRVWVRVAISPIVISFLITSAGASPSDSATSRTVAPELTLVASGSTGDSAWGGGSSSSGRRRRPPRRRGGRCGGGPPIWSRRAACESITTRRFFEASRPRRRRLDACPPGRTGFLRGRSFGGRLGFRLGLDRDPTISLGGCDRLQRLGLLHAGSCSFRFNTRGLQRRQQLFAADPLRFRDLVNPLLGH